MSLESEFPSTHHSNIINIMACYDDYLKNSNSNFELELCKNKFS